MCDGHIDQVVGYVDSKDLLNRVLGNQSTVLSSGVQIRSALIVPDTLTLSEALESFKTAGEDFAVILNEYALVVGIITLNDVMTTLMGDLVGQGREEQIVARDESSWLIEGGTPIDDVMRVLDIDEFPQAGNYETIGGFMMYMLRKIPKRTDFVKYAGYKFEVVDIDSYKIDQLLVTRLSDKPAAVLPKARKTPRRLDASRQNISGPIGAAFYRCQRSVQPNSACNSSTAVHFRHHAEMALVTNLRRQDFPLVEFKCAHVLDIQPSAKQGLNVLCHFQRVITLEDSHSFTLLPLIHALSEPPKVAASKFRTQLDCM